MTSIFIDPKYITASDKALAFIKAQMNLSPAAFISRISTSPTAGNDIMPVTGIAGESKP